MRRVAACRYRGLYQFGQRTADRYIVIGNGSLPGLCLVQNCGYGNMVSWEQYSIVHRVASVCTLDEIAVQSRAEASIKGY